MPGKGCWIAAAGCAVFCAAALVTAAAALSLLLQAGSVGGAGQPGGASGQPVGIAGCLPAASARPGSGAWSSQQVTNAATIVETGRAEGVPPQGQEIALATAMQESALRNLPGGDRDSLGLFQQRPSAGWGSAPEIMNPVYAAARFYKALLAVPGWQSMPLTRAAQAVQDSAYPDAYARWQGQAAALVATLTGATPVPAPAAGGCGNATPAAGSPGKVQAVLGFARAAQGGRYQYGGSCASPHGTRPLSRCDTSSLIQAAFARAGVTMPRTIAQQYAWGLAGHAQVIPWRQARPGDVVYMPSDQGPGIIARAGIITSPASTRMTDASAAAGQVRSDSYAPARDPYGTRMLTVLRFLAPKAGK